MTPISRQKEQVEKLLTELTAHRWENVVGLFTGENPTYEDVPANLRLTGKAGLEVAFRALGTALPDLKIDLVNAVDLPGCSIRELIFSGTHSGSYLGIESTGRPVRFACACFFLFDGNGDLATERVYFDNDTVRSQIRGIAEPYLPQRLRIAA
jgi:predicted ester cyclase